METTCAAVVARAAATAAVLPTMEATYAAVGARFAATAATSPAKAAS